MTVQCQRLMKRNASENLLKCFRGRSRRAPTSDSNKNVREHCGSAPSKSLKRIVPGQRWWKIKRTGFNVQFFPPGGLTSWLFFFEEKRPKQTFFEYAFTSFVLFCFFFSCFCIHHGKEEGNQGRNRAKTRPIAFQAGHTGPPWTTLDISAARQEKR